MAWRSVLETVEQKVAVFGSVARTTTHVTTPQLSRRYMNRTYQGGERLLKQWVELYLL